MSKTLRPAEDIAREMVPDPWTMIEDDGSTTYRSAIEAPGGHVPLHLGPFASDAADGVKVARAVLAGIIEQSRAEGEACARGHVETIDHYREGLHRIWRGEADPRSIAADYIGEDPPEQPRDLAGRIRALAIAWVDRYLGANDSNTSAVCLDIMRLIRRALRDVAAGDGVGRAVEMLRTEDVGRLGALYRSAADELEAIVRDAVEQR